MTKWFCICFRVIILWSMTLIILSSCTKRHLDTNTIATAEVEIHSVFSQNTILQEDSDSVMLFFYRDDTLFLKQRVKIPYDKIEIPCGDYSVIVLNEDGEGVAFNEMESYYSSKILLNQNVSGSFESPNNIFCFTKSSFLVSEREHNSLIVEPENLAKSIDYQLVIGGAADSMDRCIVSQPGIARGVLIHNKGLLFGADYNDKISFEATKENNFSGKVNIFGVNPDHSNLILEFYFTDNKTQNSSINISTIVNDNINAKKVIMYIDVSVINLEINATIKSWVVVEDTINI